VAIWTQKGGKAFLNVYLELLKRKSFAINRKGTFLLQRFYSVGMSFYIVDLDKRDEDLTTTKETKARRSPWDAKRFDLQ
jgi:hypothetical protein